MKKLFLLLIAFMVFCSHDMYLKLDTYFLKPNKASTIKLFNGTFNESENSITRDRMIDVSLVGNGQRIKLDTSQWTDEDNATILSFETGEPGTWVAGVSTKARNIEMDAESFNGYLEHDGVLDMLEWRKENNALDQDAVEKYSKHVKTIFQVGEKLTSDWSTPLGYPIEFIPFGNPYDLHPGHALEFQLLWQGEPLANQLVYVGTKGNSHSHSHSHADGSSHSHSHDHDTDHDHEHNELTQVRTDSSGIFYVNLTQEGIWYLRTIHLIPSDEPGLTHESNWATISFEVGEGHSHLHEVAANHSHDDEKVFGLPSYVYWIGSIVLVLILFFVFNRKS